MQVKKNIQSEKIIEKNRPYVVYKKNLVGIPNQIAGDVLYYTNYPFPKCEDYFLDEDKNLRYCDRYYPYAQGGALWMDIQSNRDERNFALKKKVLNELGLRYIAIKKDMDLAKCYEELS